MLAIAVGEREQEILALEISQSWPGEEDFVE
jgi:hypothetical protein